MLMSPSPQSPPVKGGEEKQGRLLPSKGGEETLGRLGLPPRSDKILFYPV